jgi:hypothetical protein
MNVFADFNVNRPTPIRGDSSLIRVTVRDE